MGAMSIVNTCHTYLVDAFPGKSASAIAVSYFIRSIVAAIMAIVAVPLEDAVDTGWAFSILVILSIIGIFGLVAVSYKGKYWREKDQSGNDSIVGSTNNFKMHQEKQEPHK